jgi:hypothetical protein
MGSRGKPISMGFDPQEAERFTWDRGTGTYKRPIAPYLARVPVDWIAHAGKLSKSALLTGLVCWFLDGCNRKQPFKINRATATRFGLSVHQKRRGIKDLEAAGLIKVSRSPGQLSLIEVVR